MNFGEPAVEPRLQRFSACAAGGLGRHADPAPVVVLARHAPREFLRPVHRRRPDGCGSPRTRVGRTCPRRRGARPLTRLRDRSRARCPRLPRSPRRGRCPAVRPRVREHWSPTRRCCRSPASCRHHLGDSGVEFVRNIDRDVGSIDHDRAAPRRRRCVHRRSMRRRSPRRKRCRRRSRPAGPSPA